MQPVLIPLGKNTMGAIQDFQEEGHLPTLFPLLAVDSEIPADGRTDRKNMGLLVTIWVKIILGTPTLHWIVQWARNIFPLF
jgi:hypothetical protein